MESQEEHLDRRILSSSNTSIDTGSCNLFHPEPVEEPGTSQAKNTNSELQDATESEGSVSSLHQAFNSFTLVLIECLIPLYRFCC